MLGQRRSRIPDVASFPDNVSTAAISIAVAAGGAASLKTTQLLSIEDGIAAWSVNFLTARRPPWPTSSAQGPIPKAAQDAPWRDLERAIQDARSAFQPSRHERAEIAELEHGLGAASPVVCGCGSREAEPHALATEDAGTWQHGRRAGGRRGANEDAGAARRRVHGARAVRRAGSCGRDRDYSVEAGQGWGASMDPKPLHLGEPQVGSLQVPRTSGPGGPAPISWTG